jgi:hypothetical protein
MLGRVTLDRRSVGETNNVSESLIAMLVRSVRESNHGSVSLIAMPDRSASETNHGSEGLIAMPDRRSGKENHRGIGKPPAREGVKGIFVRMPCGRRCKSSFCEAS